MNKDDKIQISGNVWRPLVTRLRVKTVQVVSIILFFFSYTCTCQKSYILIKSHCDNHFVKVTSSILISVFVQKYCNIRFCSRVVTFMKVCQEISVFQNKYCAWRDENITIILNRITDDRWCFTFRSSWFISYILEV